MESVSINEPSHKSLVLLIAYAHRPTLNTNADVFNVARGLKFGLSS